MWWAVRRRLLARAQDEPAAKVLVVGAWRNRPSTTRLEGRLLATRHRLTLQVAEPTTDRIPMLNGLLAEAQPLERFDWVVVIDDDIAVPHRFLDAFLCACRLLRFAIAQPAHLPTSHTAWRLTRRKPVLARQTAFVEIGPVVAFSKEVVDLFLPFPEVGMGWGLDAHWAYLIRERGLRAGVIDAVAVRHLNPAAAGYNRHQAIAAAQAFLAAHPFLPVSESQRTIAAYRRIPA
jgi:hypothetical protein